MSSLPELGALCAAASERLIRVKAALAEAKQHAAELSKSVREKQGSHSCPILLSYAKHFYFHLCIALTGRFVFIPFHTVSMMSLKHNLSALEDVLANPKEDATPQLSHESTDHMNVLNMQNVAQGCTEPMVEDDVVPTTANHEVLCNIDRYVHEMVNGSALTPSDPAVIKALAQLKSIEAQNRFAEAKVNEHQKLRDELESVSAAICEATLELGDLERANDALASVRADAAGMIFSESSESDSDIDVSF